MDLLVAPPLVPLTPTLGPLRRPPRAPAVRRAATTARLRRAVDASVAARTLPGDRAGHPLLRETAFRPGVAPHVWLDHVVVASCGDRRARARLVAEYQYNARSIARRFLRHSEPIDDLVQVATEALLLALDRFDPARGTPFLAYANPTITGTLKRHYRDTGWAIRVPRRVHDLAGPIRNASEMLHQDLGRPPTVHEVADLLGLEAEEVREVHGTLASRMTRSLDAEDSTTMGSLGHIDPSIEAVGERDALVRAIAQLDDEGRHVVRRYYEDGATQAQIGAELGRSQMYVSRLLSRCLDHLRATV